MSAGDGRNFDLILADLEKTIAVLAAGTAPLDQLVDAHQRATGLLAEAKSRLVELKARTGETPQLLSE